MIVIETFEAGCQPICARCSLQPLLGHSKTESTVCYLGIEVDDVSEIAEKIDI